MRPRVRRQTRPRSVAAVFELAAGILDPVEAVCKMTSSLNSASVRGTENRIGSIDDPKLWPVAGSAGQFDRDKVPGRPAGKVQFSPKPTVQLPGIAAGHAASVADRVFAEPRHLVHVAEHRSAPGLGQGDGAGVESAQAV